MKRIKHWLRTACLLVLVVTSVIGGSARSAMALESGAIARAQMDLSQDCKPDAFGNVTGAVCDADFELPAQGPACPMMNVCLNMGAVSGHCGFVTVADATPVPDACTSAVPAVYSRSAVQRSGLVADPILHPPIV